MWWISKNGHSDGPFTADQMKKRIALGLVRSLDRVSTDGSRWQYLRETELWHPTATLRRTEAPSSTTVVESFVEAVRTSPIHSVASNETSSSSPVDHTPERFRVDVVNRVGAESKRMRRTIFLAGGGLAAVLLLAVGAWAIVSVSLRKSREVGVAANSAVTNAIVSEANAAVKTGGSNFETIRDKLVIVECKESVGSGFLLAMGGKTYLVSNEHVLRSASTPTAKLLDGTLLQLGEFSVAADRRDLARFEVLNCTNAPLRLKVRALMMGEQVVMYGNSRGAGVVTESKGFVNGIGPTRFESNVEIVPGNSGSPILDMDGAVAGIAAHLQKEKDSTSTRDWGNAGTRYDGAVRRFAVTCQDVQWLTIRRGEYESQVRDLSELDMFWVCLKPFLFFDSDKVPEEYLVYNDLISKRFRVADTGFDEMMRLVATAYEKNQKAATRFFSRDRKAYIRELNNAIDNGEIEKRQGEDLLKKFDAKTEDLYEKFKAAVANVITVRKEALIHARSFLNDRNWKAPQMAKGYLDYSDDTETVEWWREGIDYHVGRMNQKMKDLDKIIKEFEKRDDDDDEE